MLDHTSKQTLKLVICTCNYLNYQIPAPKYWRLANRLLDQHSKCNVSPKNNLSFPELDMNTTTITLATIQAKSCIGKGDYLTSYTVFVWILSGLIILANILLIVVILKSKGLRSQVICFSYFLKPFSFFCRKIIWVLTEVQSDHDLSGLYRSSCWIHHSFQHY